MKKNNKFIALILTVMMIASTAVSFAGTAANGDSEVAPIKKVTAHYMFDLDETAAESVGFYYSDDFFNGPADEYNEHLATASMGLNLAAGGDSDENIASLLSDMEYKNFDSNYTKKLANNENIAFAYASKKLADGTVVVPVVVRGSHYKTEWYDNFNAGKSGDAEGFSSAAKTVCKYVNAYVSDNKFDTAKIKLWVTGYSRGAGVADLACEELTKTYSVYGYCFEAPMTNEGNGNLANIHHTRNMYDGVTCVLPSDFGFGIAGKLDNVIGDTSKEDELKETLKKVVKEDVDSLYESPKDFCWGDINIMAALLGQGFDVTPKYVSKGNQEEFWDILLGKIEKVIENRNVYTSVYDKDLMGDGAYTIEQSFMEIMKWYMSLSDEDTNRIQENLKTITDNPKDFIMSNDGVMALCLLILNDKADASLGMDKEDYQALVKVVDELINIKKDAKLTAAINGALEPLLLLIDADYADHETQILGTFFYKNTDGSGNITGSNINRLIFPHGLEITMAWLMTQDSFYEKHVIYTYGNTVKGAPALPETQAFFEGVAVNVAALPKLKGYTFSGWKNNGKVVKSFVMPDEDVTITGSWTKVVAPGKVTIKNPEAYKKAFTAKWSKQSGVYGYAINYSTSKKFKKGNRTVYVTGSSATSKKITKLKKKKTYYVRIKAYKLDSTNSKIYSGKWSKVKKVKTK